MGGANSVFKIHPQGGSTITVDCSGAQSRGAGGYVLLAQSLRLNEEKRLEVSYSKGANVDGGEAISSHGPLVPVTFTILIYSTTLAGLIAKANTLYDAVVNQEGGTLEWKPEGLGAGVPSTYYRYIQSAPPRPMGRWDYGVHDSGLYRMQMDIELMTQPYAMSDPDNPTAVLSATTVYNQDDGKVGYVTILAADIKGTEPALTQMRIRNMVSGATAAIGRLWYARRTEGNLANFVPILEGGTPDSNSTIWWSTVSDSTRRSGNYLCYAPPEAANDQWAYRTYSINDIADHEGRVAIAVICRSLAEDTSYWDLKAGLGIASIIVETPVKQISRVGIWTVCILGELDVPPTPISADESYSLTLYLYLRRNDGTEVESIGIDFLQLLYVDEYPQQVDISDGLTDASRLLLENFDQELCHVVNQSSLALEDTAETLCPPLKLRPQVDNRIDFVWERKGGTFVIFDDDFTSYEAWRWKKLADFETDEDWLEFTGTMAAETSLYVEGSRGLRGTVEYGPTGITNYQASLYCGVDWDLTVEGRFTDNDFVHLAMYLSAVDTDTNIIIRFQTSVGNYYQIGISSGSLSVGWNFIHKKKSEFIKTGNGDWSNITQVWIGYYTDTDAAYFCVDDFRIARADPDASTESNDTGEVWDCMTKQWHIYELDGTEKALGCIDTTAGVGQVACIHEEPPGNIKYLARVKAKRSNGEVGLVFRCEDGTSGSEDMAAFFVDTTNDLLELRKWTAGTASNLATAVSQAASADTDYWLGIWIIDRSTVRCYFGTSKTDIWDDEMECFKASARKFSVTDSVFASGGTLEGGTCGVLSIGTLGRFYDVELYSIGDGHIPGDTIQVESKTIYQTVYPFGA